MTKKFDSYVTSYPIFALSIYFEVKKMKKYSAKELSNLAGVSVRTLHYYDKIGLLKPALRTEAKYRWYGENELLKLQQILFYKELDFSLKEIIDIFNDPNFDLIKALESHQLALISKQKNIFQMLNTIEKTLLKLKENTMMKDEELYEGFSSEEVNNMRKEITKKYGKEKIERSENYLKQLTKEQFQKLKEEQKEIFKNLFQLSNESPEHEKVQLEIARHYKNTRTFWGTYGSSNAQAEQYKGLGELYIHDERYTQIDGKVQPNFAKFLSKAMAYFSKNLN